jgi:hypothetical protein
LILEKTKHHHYSMYTVYYDQHHKSISPEPLPEKSCFSILNATFGRALEPIEQKKGSREKTSGSGDESGSGGESGAEGGKGKSGPADSKPEPKEIEFDLDGGAGNDGGDDGVKTLQVILNCGKNEGIGLLTSAFTSSVLTLKQISNLRLTILKIS